MGYYFSLEIPCACLFRRRLLYTETAITVVLPVSLRVHRPHPCTHTITKTAYTQLLKEYSICCLTSSLAFSLSISILDILRTPLAWLSFLQVIYRLWTGVSWYATIVTLLSVGDRYSVY